MDNVVTTGNIPEGPWVVVLGMHRSGTSAVAGALGALGLKVPPPEDRIDSPKSNPEHWESESIRVFNDALLERFGGAWDAPPEFPDGWEHGPDLADLADPTPIVAAAYPDPGPIMWKDPRLCLLLPFWRPLLPAPLTAVLVWRSPVAVARSLQERDGIQFLEGVSLWERYNGSALMGLAGSDVYVIAYEDVMADPRGSLEAVTAWLASLKRFDDYLTDWDVDRAVAVIAEDLRHQTPDADDQGLLAEHRELIERLLDLQGGHQTLEIEPDIVESEWTATVVEARRQLNDRGRELEELEAELNRQAHEFEAEMNRQAREFKVELARLDDEWHRMTDETTRLNGELATLDGKLQEMGAELAMSQADREYLVDQLRRTREWITTMQSTTSWRLTRPLRSLGSLGHGGRRSSDPAEPPPE